MKKLLILSLALLLTFSLGACGTAPAAEEASAPAAAEQTEAPAAPAVGVANPLTEYETLEEINALTGGRLCTPAVMGAADFTYYTIRHSDGMLAQECFTVNGYAYTFRFCADFSRDISGLYVADGTAFSGQEPGDETQYAAGEDWKAARWFTIDGQYVLTIEDGGDMAEDSFRAIAEELRTGTLPGMSADERTAVYADMAGFYTDATSGRATAEVTANGSEGVTIVVRWANSAFETEQWVMTAAYSEDGLLSYPEEVHSVLTADESGTVTESEAEVSENSGWFDVVDGSLLWSGAASETCRSCVFVPEG